MTTYAKKARLNEFNLSKVIEKLSIISELVM